MKLKLLLSGISLTLLASVTQAAMEVSLLDAGADRYITFTYTGTGTYTGGSTETVFLSAWTGSTDGTGVTQVSNNFTGTASGVTFSYLMYNSGDNTISGFGADDPFTITGGSLTVTLTNKTYGLPSEPIEGFALGSFSGSAADGALTPVPEPSTYAALAGILMGAVALIRRQRR